MNTKKIIFAFLLTFIIFIPLKVSGQDIDFKLPAFLPDCDKTVYQVTQGGTVNCEITKVVDGKAVTTTEKVCVYPADYKPGPEGHGEIVGTFINRSCGFNDFVQLMVNAFNFGLAILAIIATFFFIWGGFGFIISGGRQEKIQESKDILKGTFYGVLIVLTAWLMVNTYIMFITGSSDSMVFPGTDNEIFWWGGGDCHKTINEPCTDKNNLYEGCGGERGSITDTYVRKLQSALNNAACGCGTVDGCFGPQTKKCVQNFQISNGIVETVAIPSGYGVPAAMPIPGREIGDGIVGEITWEYINDGKKCLDKAFDPTKVGEGEYCCLPTASCGDCACYETSDETCGGLVSKGKYTIDESKCTTHVECGYGCCIPDGASEDVLRNLGCYFSQNGVCKVEYSFISRNCFDIDTCRWWICTAGTNDCLVRRLACPGGYSKIGSSNGYGNKPDAEAKMLTIDECNKGYCYSESNISLDKYQCTYISFSKCNAAGGSFLWGGRCIPGFPCTLLDADNNDTGIECRNAWIIP